MLLFSFEHPQPENLFYGKRFVFKDREGASLLQVKHYGEKIPGAEKTDEPEEKTFKGQKDSAEASEVPKETLDKRPIEKSEKDRTRRIEQVKQEARKGRETIHRRLERLGVFKNKAERLKYVGKVRDAIEKLKPDQWYKFVKEHQIYNGDYRQWNKDFCELLGGSKLSPAVQRKYVAGLQAFLTGRFAEAASPVKFELKEGKRINRFTYVDGMLGGYTVSVLGAYLTSDLYNKKKSEWKRLYATLNPEFTAKQKGRQKTFDKAILHLKSQLVAKTPLPQELTGENKDQKEEKNSQKPPQEEKRSEESAVEEKEQEKKLETSVEAVMKNVNRYAKREVQQELDELRNENIVDLRAIHKEGRDPDAFGILTNNSFDDKEWSWPYWAYKEYENAYEAWEENQDDPETIKQKDKAWYILKVSVEGDAKAGKESYYQLIQDRFKELRKEKKEELKKLYKKYTYLIKPGDSNHALSKELPTARKLNREMKNLFGEDMPSEEIKNWGELMKSLKDPQLADSLKYRISMDEETVVKEVNKMIRLNNRNILRTHLAAMAVRFRGELGKELKSFKDGYETWKTELFIQKEEEGPQEGKLVS
ncbi:hypothetical protein KKA33_03235 [Patescibacteria group bacterium]|nr:hypothetical protein [Patescibacteria group bacterium]